MAYFGKNTNTQEINDTGPAMQVRLGAEQVGSEHVANGSGSLTAIERNYSHTEKEVLGLVWAFERFLGFSLNKH